MGTWREKMAERHLDLGEDLLRRARPAEAERHFRRAVSAAPRESVAYQFLSIALASLSRLAEAEVVQQAAVRLV